VRAIALALLSNTPIAIAAPGPAPAPAPATATATATAPVSGIAVEYIDPAVRAQDDFFTHLNGKWLATAEIPADKSSWGAFAKLRDDLTPQLRGIVEVQQQAHAKRGTEAQKIADFYTSYLDEKRLDTLGARPLAGELARIRAVRTKQAIPTLIAHLAQIGVATPYGLSVGPDARASTIYAANLSQGGLGMPDRDYYLEAKLAPVKAQYLAHVEKMLAMAGSNAADAASGAAAVVALETALAQIQMSKVDSRDPVKRYNKVSIAKLAEQTPGYDWKGGLAAAGIANRVDYVIVNQPAYLDGFAKLVDQTDLATWKAYFEWQLIRAYANYLSADFVDAHFAFYGTVITGVPQNLPRWKRGLAALEGVLGEALGKLYVAQYFPPERKTHMEGLVKNLLVAYRDSIATLDWMSPETKREAQAKLAKFTPKIGYPERWRDYSTLAIVPGDLVGNMMRSAEFSHKRQINKLGRPIDRTEWGMTPQTVNAYYNATMNEIVFPAAILQPPFFDAAADDAVNYGAIGAVIGHEISHGFDDKGSQSDGDGNLRDWWTAADRARFAAKAAMLVQQYDSYSPLPGYHVNGALTLGENIADNSGVAIAYKAYHLALDGKTAPVLDGLSGDQRFFMGFGQVWRSKMRPAQQILQLKSDSHAPGQFRANGTMKNQPAFYDAFDIKPGDPMYLAPAQRVLMW
jgi:predicted metalloendopeptidase